MVSYSYLYIESSHSVSVGNTHIWFILNNSLYTCRYFDILIYIPDTRQTWPRMFYRSGWLRCHVFISMLGFVLVYPVSGLRWRNPVRVLDSGLCFKNSGVFLVCVLAGIWFGCWRLTYGVYILYVYIYYILLYTYIYIYYYYIIYYTYTYIYILIFYTILSFPLFSSLLFSSPPLQSSSTPYPFPTPQLPSLSIFCSYVSCLTWCVTLGVLFYLIYK